MEQVKKNASLFVRSDGRVIVEWNSRGRKRQKSFSGPQAKAKAEREVSRRNGEQKAAKNTAQATANAVTKRRATAKNHKTKSDTLAGEIATMQGALSGELEPPAHITLTDEERPFWNSIMMARAHGTWNESDLEQAAILAQTKAAIVRLTKEIGEEGFETRQLNSARYTEDGEIIASTAIYRIGPNPKIKTVSSLKRDALAIARAIHVDATSTLGRGRDTGEKTKREREARALIQHGDDLIARPIVQ